MSQLGEAFRHHHRALLERLERYVAALQGPDVDSRAGELVAFLQQELLPHARGEERHLYPAVEPLLHQTRRATATMSVDHEALEGYVWRVAQAAEQLRMAPATQRPEAQKQLQRLALELAAVLRLHTEKEERVYLPLVEQYLTDEDQRRLLQAMHEEEQEAPGQSSHRPAHKEVFLPEVSLPKEASFPPKEGSPGDEGDGRLLRQIPSDGPVLDVRPLPPPRRHPLIFQTFDHLSPGQALELINDHDPRPLYYQFAAERPGQFTWQYLQQGPDVWRVRIGRLPADPAGSPPSWGGMGSPPAASRPADDPTSQELEG